LLFPLKSKTLLHCLAALAISGCVLSAQAQERIYRCGNEYINNTEVAKSRGCVALEGGHITTVPGTQPQPQIQTQPQRSGEALPPRVSAPALSAPRNSNKRVDTSAQRERDSDARRILETELQRAQQRLAQAQKDQAKAALPAPGLPAPEQQRYLDRVAERKAAVLRAQGDVDSLRRELGRFGASAGAPTLERIP